MQLRKDTFCFIFLRLNLHETSVERVIYDYSRVIVSHATSLGKAALNFPSQRTQRCVAGRQGWVTASVATPKVHNLRHPEIRVFSSTRSPVKMQERSRQEMRATRRSIRHPTLSQVPRVG